MTTSRKRSAARQSTSPPLQVAEPKAGENGSASKEETLCNLYAVMLRCRLATQHAQNDNSCNLYDLATGLEAITVGSAADLQPGDSIAASRRNLPAVVARGRLLKCCISNTVGSDSVRPDSAEAHAPSHVRLLQGSNPFHQGTGAALAHKLDGHHRVAVALGDQPESLDGWHDAFRFAGIHKLPVIYVAISSASRESLIATHSHCFDDVSLMASDYGFPGIIVDGADAVAVWRVAQESIHRARNGSGPTLIECRAEMPGSTDPLAHLQHYMEKRDLWDEGWRRKLEAQIESELERSLR